MSTSAATLPLSQMPYPDFIVDGITVDDVLNFPYEITAFDADLSIPELKDQWQESRNYTAPLS